MSREGAGEEMKGKDRPTALRPSSRLPIRTEPCPRLRLSLPKLTSALRTVPARLKRSCRRTPSLEMSREMATEDARTHLKVLPPDSERDVAHEEAHPGVWSGIVRGQVRQARGGACADGLGGRRPGRVRGCEEDELVDVDV